VPTTLEVIAEPRRRQILDLLRDEERLVADLADRLGLAQPNVSKHLRVLREAGLVTVRPDGARRWYRVRPQPFAELDAWLAPYRRLWTTALVDLDAHLDDMED
jgi:DNA-binding transcriptional ArsR family regulator